MNVPPASFAGTGAEPLTLRVTSSTPVVRRSRKACGSFDGSETRTRLPPVAQEISSRISVPVLLDPSSSVWMVAPSPCALTAAACARFLFDWPSVNSMITRDESGRPCARSSFNAVLMPAARLVLPERGMSRSAWATSLRSDVIGCTSSPRLSKLTTPILISLLGESFSTRPIAPAERKSLGSVPRRLVDVSMTNIMSRYLTPPIVDATPSTSMAFSPEFATKSGDGDWISICSPFGVVAPLPVCWPIAFDAAKHARNAASMADLFRMSAPAPERTRLTAEICPS